MYKWLISLLLLELPMDQFQQKSDRMKTTQSGEQVYTIPRSNVDFILIVICVDSSQKYTWNVEQLTNVHQT